MDLQYMTPVIIYIVEKKCTPNWSLKEEVIDTHNFMLVHSGEVSICIGKGDNWQTIKQGNLIYFPKGCIRKAKTNPDNLLHLFSIKSDFIFCIHRDDEFYLEKPTECLPFETVTNVQHLPDLMGKFFEISKEWTNRKPGFNLKCRSLYMDIIYELQKHSRYGNIGISTVRKVEKIIDYIASHHMKELSLKEIANHVGLSEVYTGQVLKKATGYTPIEYLHYIRTNKAKDLLQNGNYTVSEVAELVGYNDLYYFSRMFKRIIGNPPSKYKN